MRKREMTMRLTKKHKQALQAVAHGADVFNYSTATTLREIERHRPELVTITEPMGDYGGGAGREPYLGAIATAKGIQVSQ